jgi:Tol biopolymer transport system component
MPSRSFFRRPAVVLALALCAVAAVVSLLGKLAGGGNSAQKAVALVNSSGAESYPSFSPDGNRLAYSARRGKESFHLYVRRLPSGAPQQLTDGADSDTGPAWSPDGATIAFLRGDGADAQCMTVPAAGGAERRVARCGAPAQSEVLPPALAWMPDGKALIAAVASGEEPKKPEKAISVTAGKMDDPDSPRFDERTGDGLKSEPGPAYALTVIPLDGSAAKRLTEPPPGGRGDFSPAVSPDGSTLAFVRDPRQGAPDIFVLDLPGGGKPRQLTFEGNGIRGLAWAANGRDLVFSGDRGPGGWRLWRVPASGGSPRDLIVSGRRAQYPAVARAGGRLAYTETPSVAAIWRSPLGGDDPAAGAALVRSTGRESSPSYSPDGKRIASISDQSGADEIWVSDAEGGNRRQVTHFANRARPNRPRWSPDASKLLFEVRGLGEIGLYTAPLGGGEPQRVVNGSGGSWSHDGASIYYADRGQVWKAPVAGGDPRRLTNHPGGGMQPEESADGKYVYYRQWRSIWRVPAQGEGEEEFMQPEHELVWGALQPVAKGLYYVEWNRGNREQAIAYYDFATRKSTQAFAAKNADIANFSISPDGKYVLYSRVDQSETNLMLVEGFR